MARKDKRARVIKFYREVEGLHVPTRLLFDDRFSPSEKMILSLICTLCWQNAENGGGMWTDYTNWEMDNLIGGVSVRSVHRHLKRFREMGLIQVKLDYLPNQTNYRQIFLTSKGINYFFDIDMDDSITAKDKKDGIFL